MGNISVQGQCNYLLTMDGDRVMKISFGKTIIIALLLVASSRIGAMESGAGSSSAACSSAVPVDPQNMRIQRVQVQPGPDRGIFTALMEAALFNNREIVNLLITHRAHINAELNYVVHGMPHHHMPELVEDMPGLIDDMPGLE